MGKIEDDIALISNETAEGGNTKERVAGVLQALNEKKLDSNELLLQLITILRKAGNFKNGVLLQAGDVVVRFESNDVYVDCKIVNISGDDTKIIGNDFVSIISKKGSRLELSALTKIKSESFYLEGKNSQKMKDVYIQSASCVANGDGSGNFDISQYNSVSIAANSIIFYSGDKTLDVSQTMSTIENLVTKVQDLENKVQDLEYKMSSVESRLNNGNL